MQSQKFAGVRAGASWNNPQNLLQVVTDGVFATTTGPDPAFVSLNFDQPGRGNASFSGSTITDIRVRFNGSGVGTTQILNFCLSADSGQTCLSRVQTITLPALPGSVQFPEPFPSPFFAKWDLRSFPQHNLVAPWVTVVSASGNDTIVRNLTNVPSATGLFPTNLPAGSKVLIQGSACPGQMCTVQSVLSATTMILAENPGALTGAVADAREFRRARLDGHGRACECRAFV
ncbi:MAG: hypothetical protein WDO18_02345 [Acidobacteriota bacterium]